MSPTTIAATPWNLLAGTGAILAFLIGLYTLVGRERKSPYVINSVFTIFIVGLIGALVDLLANFIPSWQDELLKVGAAILFLVVLLTTWRIYKIFMRFALFVDSPHPKHWRFFRQRKDRSRAKKNKKPYEHNPIPVPEEVVKQVVDILKSSKKDVDERQGLQPNSVAIGLRHQGQANEYLAKIAMSFLKRQFAFQYIATSRHPLEFIRYLRDAMEAAELGSWVQAAGHIVVVDAYTKHFGFTDSIYFDATRDLERLGVSYIAPAESYAGLHSATSKAFNVLQEQAKSSGGGGAVRKPALIIYEDCYAIADLESPEQYRIFIRHVLPSERAWDGMFTVVAETVQPENDWKLLTSYTSFSLDLRDVKAENSSD